MSEPIVYTQREHAGPLVSKEVTTTYEEILRDFDDPCLVRSLVDRCLVLERELAEARAEASRFEGLMLAAESEAHDSRAEVEAAARWFYDEAANPFADEESEETFDAAWSRYQQERQ